jgi:hypothetical protein
VSNRQTTATAKSPTLPGPGITSRLGQGSASAPSTTTSNQTSLFSWAQPVPLRSGTIASRESITSTSNVASSSQTSAPISGAQPTGKS